MMPKLDVLICVADGVLYGDLDYGSRIEERLSAAGLTCGRYDLTALPGDEPPPARSYVFTGGETAVGSGAPWMRSAIDTARSLVTGADREDYPVIGICLGSQILAESLRPDSLIWSPAIEVGLTAVSRPGDTGTRQIVPAFHYQSVSPEIRSVCGARVEWRNAHTAVQAFSYGKHGFGCQFHPELSAADVHNIIDCHGDVITQWGGDTAAAHQSVDQHAGALSADLFRRMVTDRIPG
jgi:GMP synthase (glutamine-hydrolysing)